MDGLMEPSMPKMPSVIQKMKETGGGATAPTAGPPSSAPPTTQYDDTEARRSSFDEEDQVMLGLGLTADKKKFSFGAGRKSTVTPVIEDKKEKLGPRVHLTARQKNDIALAFEAFDVSGTGYMSTVDLRVAFRALGFDAKKEEVKKMLDIFDKGKTGRLCYTDFITIIELKLGEDDSREDIIKAFKLFDKDATGHISFNNLRQVATELNEDVNDEEIAEMLAEADLDDDGTLDFEEFFKIMKKATLY